MKGKIAYIAGPIQGYEDEQNYRDVIADILSKRNIGSIDPWKRETVVYDAKSDSHDKSKIGAFIKMDLSDISRCDYYIAYLPVLSAGTCMEMFYAKMKGVKTITISKIENPSPWLVYHSDFMIKSINELDEILGSLTGGK